MGKATLNDRGGEAKSGSFVKIYILPSHIPKIDPYHKVKPIYKNGEIVDFSDEGEQLKKVNNEVEIYYALKRLSRRQREAVELILKGYKEVEIAEKLSISQPSVSKLLKRAGHILGDLPV